MSYKVSVVIPTYKRSPEMLKRAIETVLAQTYENIEVVVIDDNVGDGIQSYRDRVQRMIKEYKENSKVVYKQNQENLGGALSRNEGIAAATGEYITFLDDDDIYLPHKIEKQLNFMIENNLDMTFTNLILHNEKDQVVDYRSFGSIPNFEKLTLLKYHLTRHITGTPTFMYRKKALEEIKGFEQAKVGQEFYLMLKTIENDCKIGYFDTCDVIAYRHKGESISNGKNKIVGEEYLYQFKKRYFYVLNSREVRFIKFRYLVVIAIAYKRNSNFKEAIKSLIKAFFISPIDFILEGSRQVKKLLKYNFKHTSS